MAVELYFIQLLTGPKLLKENTLLFTTLGLEKAIFGGLRKEKGWIDLSKEHTVVCLSLHHPQPTTLSPGESESWLNIFTQQTGE